jgi:predicted DsbA family dithiol-disulfide isomerase
VRDVEVSWRLFSLETIHEGKEDPLADLHAKGTPALRTLAAVRRASGNEGVGRLYEAIGRRVHEDGEELSPEVVEKALADAGLNASLVWQALEDDSTASDVRAEHDAVVSEVGAFGVPTIVLEGGEGIFGPVLSSAPEGKEAGELWDHVRWLTERGYFFELKRERDRAPREGR